MPGFSFAGLWCWDWWQTPYDSGPLSDPHGPDTGASRSERGGSWFYDADYLVCAYRDVYYPYGEGQQHRLPPCED